MVLIANALWDYLVLLWVLADCQNLWLEDVVACAGLAVLHNGKKIEVFADPTPQQIQEAAKIAGQDRAWITQRTDA